MRFSSRICLVAGSCSALFVATASQAEFYDYNDTNELTNNFVLNSTGTNWSQVNSGGLNNTGYVATSNDNGYITEKISFSLDTDADSTFTISSAFLVGSASGTTSGRRGLSLGVSTSDSVNYEGGGRLEDTSLYASLFGNGDGSTANTTNFRYAADTSNPDVTDGLSVSSNDDLAFNTWYFLDAIYSYDSTNNQFDITVKVFNNSSGAKGSQIRSVDIGTDIANPFGADPTLYGFAGGRDSADAGVNIAGIDNFDSPAVPEPASLALIGIGGALLLGRRRK
jgi:hypothetical protein